MKSVTRSRRLAAVATGLVIGVVGTVATSVSAMAAVQAQDLVTHVASFVDVCDGMYVSVSTDADSTTTPDWEVRFDGKLIWPGAGDELPGPGDAEVLFLPPGVVEVTFAGAPESEWPQKNTWREPSFCADLPQPTAAQPTCEEPGFIDIPALPDRAPILEEIFGQTPDPRTTLSVQQDPVTNTLMYGLDGMDVAPESTHQVEPGTHVVSLRLVIEQGGVKLGDLNLDSWSFQIDEPDCPEENGGGEGGGDGEGGELPKTGVPIGWVAGVAAALIALGAGLFLAARRRRETFSA